MCPDRQVVSVCLCNSAASLSETNKRFRPQHFSFCLDWFHFSIALSPFLLQMSTLTHNNDHQLALLAVVPIQHN